MQTRYLSHGLLSHAKTSPLEASILRNVDCLKEVAGRTKIDLKWTPLAISSFWSGRVHTTSFKVSATVEIANLKFCCRQNNKMIWKYWAAYVNEFNIDAKLQEMSLCMWRCLFDNKKLNQREIVLCIQAVGCLLLDIWILLFCKSKHMFAFVSHFSSQPRYLHATLWRRARVKFASLLCTQKEARCSHSHMEPSSHTSESAGKHGFWNPVLEDFQSCGGMESALGLLFPSVQSFFNASSLARGQDSNQRRLGTGPLRRLIVLKKEKVS